ncbi:MAG: tRNA (adenine-N1)-methyltransferase, partial [Methanobacterium sp.]|nr:tRNA (adenine-N1)-methyltransferase [Methanobacterium sp.]
MRILIDEKGKKFVVSEGDLHTNWGYIKKETIENSSDGDVLETHMGHKFTIIKPSINDYIDLMERKCSIILPKDIGLITAYTGLGSGYKVVEAGTGSGATALYFANIVGPTGEVFSYEIREDFTEIALKNISNFGLENVNVKNKDIKLGIDESRIDMIFLDLPEPWAVVEHAFSSLKVGGYLAAYNPYIEQVFTLNKVLKKNSFSD